MNNDFTFGTGKFRWVVNNNDYGRGISMRSIGLREQLDWMKRQIEYYSFAEKYKLRYDLKKGEIYEIDFGINVNSEFSNRHYGVVLKDSNEYNPLVLICPLKTNHKGAHPRSDVDIGYVQDLKSTHSTLAVINQIKAVDKLRIYSKNQIGVTDGLVLAESQNEVENDFIPRLTDKQLELIMNAYCNFVFGADN